MKAYQCNNSIKGKTTIVVAKSLKEAIELFKKCHGDEPDKIEYITSQTVIIQGFIEPELKF